MGSFVQGLLFAALVYLLIKVVDDRDRGGGSDPNPTSKGRVYIKWDYRVGDNQPDGIPVSFTVNVSSDGSPLPNRKIVVAVGGNSVQSFTNESGVCTLSTVLPLYTISPVNFGIQVYNPNLDIEGEIRNGSIYF